MCFSVVSIATILVTMMYLFRKPATLYTCRQKQIHTAPTLVSINISIYCLFLLYVEKMTQHRNNCTATATDSITAELNCTAFLFLFLYLVQVCSDCRAVCNIFCFGFCFYFDSVTLNFHQLCIIMTNEEKIKIIVFKCMFVIWSF